MRRLATLPDSGVLLHLLAVGHALVGLTVYRRQLRSLRRDGLIGGVPCRGPKATAFWFLAPSPLVWIVGTLVSHAEAAGDAEALRKTHRVSLLSAAMAVLCLPVSGFWGWLAISARGLWQGGRTGR